MAHVLGVAAVEEGAEPHRVDSNTPYLMDRLSELGPRVIVVRRTLDHGDGLSICRALRAHARLRHARVLVVSTEQQTARDALAAGAHGHLLMPCRVPQAREAVRAQLEARPVVLVVDDSRAQRMVVVPSLRAEGWAVVEAEDGIDAQERLHARGGVDLVLSDVEMPRMDGMALCAAIKGDAATAHIPVVLVTSLDSSDSIARGFAAGANDYLTKPVVLSELISRAKRLLAPRQTQRPERALIVDPDAVRRTALEMALQAHGLETGSAADAASAWVMLAAGGFQLVVSDLDLPDADGVDLARKMRGEQALADLPFVLVTGRKGRVEDVRAASAGVQSVVARPYQPDRLLAEVERVLAEARITRQRTILRRYLSGEALAAMERFVDTGGVTSRAALRHRTVLFADLAGFTSLCEHKDAEEVVQILNRFFDATVPTLVRHGASIDKFIGDCIMAVYDGEAVGARGAVAGALEVVQIVVPALQAELGIPLNLRVGINSGDVIVGDIGSRDFRRDFTVIGDAVNVAQRIQSNAEVGEVLIGESTRALVAEFFQFGEARQLQLKGRNAAANAYPVTAQG